MNIETLREFCLLLPDTTESFPFDDVTLVLKVGGKMYALINLDGELSINLKCDPEMAIDLRERYAAVLPGYHMNKTHWNTVKIDGSIPDATIHDWIVHSYELVYSSLPRKIRNYIPRKK